MAIDVDSEAALERATMQLFASLGWQTANAFYEAFAPEQATPARPHPFSLCRERLCQAEGAFQLRLPPFSVSWVWFPATAQSQKGGEEGIYA